MQLGEIRSQDGELVLEARELEYDVLILALGSQANDFGVPGVREHCYFIDSQKQAETFNEALRVRVFRSIARDEPFRVAIVGGRDRRGTRGGTEPLAGSGTGVR